MFTSFPFCRILIAELTTESKNSTTSLFCTLITPRRFRKGNITEMFRARSYIIFLVDETINGLKQQICFYILYRQFVK